MCNDNKREESGKDIKMMMMMMVVLMMMIIMMMMMMMTRMTLLLLLGWSWVKKGGGMAESQPANETGVR